MVFSSIPVYLDPPNWTQQQAEPPGVVLGNGAHHDDQGINPQLLPSVSAGGGPGGNSNIRLGSMTDRARLAKIPQPEAALKCPRCESTNTKFCYFNNYSLTQPRHFCKTCRRYWTRGGALRNVPVGGGCRRNKRSSKSRSSRSKSPAIDHHVLPQAAHHGGSTSTNTDSSNGCAADPHVIGYFDPTASPQLPFLPSLHHLSSSDYGFNFAGLSSNQPQVLATIAQGTGPGNIPEQLRLNQVQQFSFSTNLEPPCVSGLCTFDQGVNRVCNMSKPFDNSGAIVKMEENRRHHDLSRKFMGGQGNGTHDDDHQFNWSEGNHAWNDLSGFNSSSSSHLL